MNMALRYWRDAQPMRQHRRKKKRRKRSRNSEACWTRNRLLNGERQTQGKDRTLIDTTGHRDRSAVGCRDSLHDRKSEPRTTRVFCAGPIGPIKPLEEVREVLSFNAMTRIFDNDSDPLVDRLQADRHSAPRRGITESIVEEIHHCLFDPLCITVDIWHWLGFKRQSDSALIKQYLQFSQEIMDQGSQGEWREMNGRRIACELRERQEGTGQRDEPSHLLEIVDEGLAILFVRPGFEERDLQVTLHNGKGRLHFVSGMVDKSPLTFHASLKPVHHGIECLRKPAKFLIGRTENQPFPEIGFAHRFRSGA